MRCITLLTDFGDADGFVGIMKGVIYSINPKAQVVDISHHIPSQNIQAGAFVLRSAYRFFPSDTIHVIVIDPGVGSSRKIILCQANEQFFIAPDNGVLKYIFREHSINEVIEIHNPDFFLPDVSRTFHGRDIFAPVAAHLSQNINPNQLGSKCTQFIHGKIPQIIYHRNTLQGEIVYIDKFGNLITNISRNDIPDQARGETLLIRINRLKIQGIRQSYTEAKPGIPIAIWGSSNTLEIAMNQMNAHAQLNLGIGEHVRLEWA